MAFEDSGHGVRSAADAGIGTVVVTVNGYTREQDFSGATMVVDSFGEPDTPCELLSGRMDGSRYVDLSLVHGLHDAAREGT